MIKIDGQVFRVPVLTMKRKADVLDKFAQRTESGDLEREIIGVYFNYSLQFGFPSDNPLEYVRLWDKLTEPSAFHEISLYDEKGVYNFTGYISGVQDEILYVQLEKSSGKCKVKCKALSCNMTAKLPSRS